MLKLKSHKTVEQIAKKHRLEVSFVQNQLDMGIPIEHEHTKDKELAKDIALQHLDEIPDYYSRLKKMEASAKKEHKKFKDVKEDLGDWFNPNHPDGGWKRYNTKGEVIGPCAREPGEPKPKCLSNKKAAQLRSQGGVKKIASAVKRKRKKDPVANRSEKGGKPIMVSNKITEENEEKRYCPLCDKRETRSECSYGSKAWDKVSVKDHEYSMARSELQTIISAAQRIRNKVSKGEGSLEAWVQSKITKAADYIDTAADYIDSGEMQENAIKVRRGILPLSGPETVLKKSSGAGALTPDAAQQLGPKAVELQKKKAASVSLPSMNTEKKIVDKILGEIIIEKCWTGYKRKKETIEFKNGSRIKNENVTIEDVDGNTFAEVVDLIKPEPIKGFKSQIEEENKPTNPSLWSKAKSLAKQKFDVYPSAYANGWAVKWYKSKGGGWKSVSEETEINEAVRLQSHTGNVMAVTLLWRGRYYGIRMFFPQIRIPSRQDISDEIKKVYPDARVISHSVSEFTPGQPLIQAGFQGGSPGKIGPNKNYIKTMGEEMELKEEGPSLSVGRGEKLPVSRGGGLTEKGRKKYNRATGSNLQAPVTGDVKPGSKAAKRRKAFCSRSRSWRGERGLAARRRWKC